jgi:hypothetical protein
MTWRRVSELMPAALQDVLVFMGHDDEGAPDIDMGYLGRDGLFRRTGEDFRCQPTHWMPLPEAPTA